MNALTENEIYSVLLDTMLTFVREKGLDSSEGSVCYDLLAPAALAMTTLYLRIEEAMSECFADTASLENLKRMAAERGLDYREAAAPQVEIALASGSLDLTADRSENRFSLGDLTFYAAEQTQDGYRLVCETACALGTRAAEQPVYLGSDRSVGGVTVLRVLTPGRDAETKEELRGRYFASVRSAAFAGDRAAYTELARSVPGVGGCKAERADMQTDGCNVLLTIISDEQGVPAQSVLDAVAAAVSRELPICHVCSVRAVTEDPIGVSARIVKKDGYSSASVREAVRAKIAERMKRLSAVWAEEGSVVLRSSEIFTAILEADGVLDVHEVSVTRGGQTVGSIVFDGGTIPTPGTLTLTEETE